jgi:hypothetical protein
MVSWQCAGKELWSCSRTPQDNGTTTTKPQVEPVIRTSEHSDYLIFLNVDPMADSLRDIPSFQALLGQIGPTK